MLFVLGASPFIFTNTVVGVDYTTTFGHASRYQCVAYWGLAVLLLALRPTDGFAIGFACHFFFFCINLPFTFLYVWLSSIESQPSRRLWMLSSAVLFCATSVLLFPTVLCHRACLCGRMPITAPRRQLLRLWDTTRFFLLSQVCTSALYLIAHGLNDGWMNLFHVPANDGELINVILVLPAPFLFAQKYRGIVHRWLGTLGKSGSQEQEAAAVASLIGGRGVADALRIARQKFRVLPLTHFTADDLAPGVDLAAANSLSSRTRSAALGECDAFMSHSWRDDGDKKFMRLREHAWDTSEPTIWLDKVCAFALLFLHVHALNTHASGQMCGAGVHRPDQHRCVAGRAPHLSFGLQDVAHSAGHDLRHSVVASLHGSRNHLVHVLLISCLTRLHAILA
jgi:hypothetical protein